MSVSRFLPHMPAHHHHLLLSLSLLVGLVAVCLSVTSKIISWNLVCLQLFPMSRWLQWVYHPEISQCLDDCIGCIIQRYHTSMLHECYSNVALHDYLQWQMMWERMDKPRHNNNLMSILAHNCSYSDGPANALCCSCWTILHTFLLLQRFQA